MLYLIVVADGVSLNTVLHLDGKREIPVHVVDQGLQGAGHEPELLREVAAEHTRLVFWGGGGLGQK